MEISQADLEQLRALMELMEQHDFQELDLRDGERRLGRYSGGPR